MHAAEGTEAPSLPAHSPENCSWGQNPRPQLPSPVNITKVFKGPLGCTMGPASPLLEQGGPYRDPTLQQMQISTLQVRLLRLPPTLKIGLHIPCLPEDHSGSVTVGAKSPQVASRWVFGCTNPCLCSHGQKHSIYVSAQTQDQ